MGDTTTPNVGLVKPAIGASRSTWGNKWNGNADTLDGYLNSLGDQIATLDAQVATLDAQVAALEASAGVGAMPIGAVICWPTDIDYPPGYLICDGSWQSSAQYPALFAVILGYFGWDGTNFLLPDYRGCVLAQDDAGTGRLGDLPGSGTIGALIGTPIIALDWSQMPSHVHGGYTDWQGQHAHTISEFATYGGGSSTGFQYAGAEQPQIYYTDADGEHYHTLEMDAQGGGQGHSNIQVSAIVRWLIRAA